MFGDSVMVSLMTKMILSNEASAEFALITGNEVMPSEKK